MVNGRLQQSGSTTRENLVAAAVRLAAAQGTDTTSVRSIAREAGVTEAMLYRHFKNKQDLWLDIYTRIVDDMIEEKKSLLHDSAPIRERLREWVRLTYAYYDDNPDAFTYVLLLPHSFAEALGDTCTRQGHLLLELIAEGQHSGECRPLDPQLALTLFSGLLLSVPRLINEGRLEGPATSHVDDVAAAAWRVLGQSGTS